MTEVTRPCQVTLERYVRPPAVSVATNTVPAGSGPGLRNGNLVLFVWTQRASGGGEQIDQRGAGPAPLKFATSEGLPRVSNTARISREPVARADDVRGRRSSRADDVPGRR